MTGWFDGTVIANGISLHYIRTGGPSGNAKPPLLIVTGVTDMGIGYARVARALEADYDIVMYDARGHGLSEKPSTDYTFEEHAADLVGLIAALELDRPRILAHSGGAAAAMIAAADHPGLISGLILYDPCWGSGWGGWNSTVTGLRDWFSHVTSMNRNELMTAWRNDNPDWTEEELAYQVESKLQVSPYVAKTFDQPEPRWREALPRISCPILLLTGDAENGLVTQADVQAMASLWRDGEVVQIDGAGHMAHYDCFDQFVQAVKSFLTKG